MRNRRQCALTQLGNNMLLAVIHFNSGFINYRTDQTHSLSYAVSVTFVVLTSLLIITVLGILLSPHAFWIHSLSTNQAELPFHFSV